MSFKPLLLAAALGLVTSACASAQLAPPHDHGLAPAQAAAPAGHAAKGGMMAKGGMKGAMMGMAPMHCMGQSEPRLSGLKAKLNITDQQLGAWDAFTATVKADPHAMHDGATLHMKHGAKPGGDDMMAMMSKPLPERLAHHEMMMKAQLKALPKLQAVVSDLYGVLTPEQRAIADKSLCGGMS